MEHKLLWARCSENRIVVCDLNPTVCYTPLITGTCFGTCIASTDKAQFLHGQCHCHNVRHCINYPHKLFLLRDLFLYTHLTYKSKRFFELLEELRSSSIHEPKNAKKSATLHSDRSHIRMWVKPSRMGAKWCASCIKRKIQINAHLNRTPNLVSFINSPTLPL